MYWSCWTQPIRERRRCRRRRLPTHCPHLAGISQHAALFKCRQCRQSFKCATDRRSCDCNPLAPCRAACRLVCRAWVATPQPAAHLTRLGGGAEKLSLLTQAPAFRGVRQLELCAEPGVLGFLARAGGLPALRELTLTDVEPALWPGLGATIARAAPHLQRLSIEGPGDADADMEGGLDALLAGLPLLQVLSTNEVVGCRVRPIAVASSLRLLRIGYLPTGVDWAAHFPALEELHWLDPEAYADFSRLGGGLHKLDVWNYTSVVWPAAALPHLRWLACQVQFLDGLPPLPRLEALKVNDMCLHPRWGGENDLRDAHNDALVLAQAYPQLSSLTFADVSHGGEWEGPHAVMAINAVAALQRALAPRVAFFIE